MRQWTGERRGHEGGVGKCCGKLHPSKCTWAPPACMKGHAHFVLFLFLLSHTCRSAHCVAAWQTPIHNRSVHYSNHHFSQLPLSVHAHLKHLKHALVCRMLAVVGRQQGLIIITTATLSARPPEARPGLQSARCWWEAAGAHSPQGRPPALGACLCDCMLVRSELRAQHEN